MQRARLLIAFPFWLAAASAGAGLSEGYDAFQLGDYERALEEFTPLARGADPIGAYYLGLLYFEGRGVARNTAIGVRWLELAAESGHTGAQLRLAAAYEEGDGVEQDYRLAARWMLEAARGGNANAQYYVGQYFRLGRGVVQDDLQAYEWVHRSVEYGISHERVLDALLYLGAANEWGRGRRQDLVEAYKWYSLAASYSTDDARMYAEAGRAMDALRIRIGAGELAEAGRRAHAWQEDKRQMYASE